MARMIAIDVGDGGDRVASRLRRTLGLDADDLVVLSDDDVDTRGAGVLLSGGSRRDRLEKVITADTEWIHVLQTGVDGFPFDLTGDRLLTCSRGASSVAISEFVLAAMLAFVKRVPEVWISGPDESNAIELGQLAGRTLGLIGIGGIGSATAARALAFDMHVTAYRRTGSPSPVDGVVIASDLEELLGASDHVVVAAPATAASRHLLDRRAFDSMRDGVHLVNISRGALVDQDALLGALESGRVAMATLDVTDPEPLSPGHPLYSHPRVRVSPHVSWSAPSTMRRSMELFEENFLLHVAGRPLSGVVDTAAGY